MENTPRRILAVLAHPDDETFGIGGTLARYSHEGCDIYLICATRGEAGGITQEGLGIHKTIGELREAELHCAAEIIGIKEIAFLGFRDSGMDGTPDNQNPLALINQNIEKVAVSIAGYIRTIKPEIVITHDPIGGYRHPDHIFVHRATVQGFSIAGDQQLKIKNTIPFQPEKLYFHTFQRSFLKKAVKILRVLHKDPTKFGRNNDIDLESFAGEDFDIHVEINIRKFIPVKEKAGKCHSSQGGGRIGGGVMGLLLKLFNTREVFIQSYPPIIENKKVAKKRL